MEIIFWSSVTLFIIALIVVAILVKKERKIYANKSKPDGYLESDDLPGRYMDLLDCEQSFVERY